MSIYFETIEFTRSHGITPRGEGCWAFRFGHFNYDVEFAPGTMLYSAAKKWAAARAKEVGVNTVYVQP